MLRAPAIKALLFQGLAFFLVILLLAVLETGTPLRPGFIVATLLQGTLAALFSRWARLAWWWLPIQFFFPFAVFAFLSLHLPQWLFLGLFLVFLVLYWSSFRTQVPYYPSHPAVRQAVADLLPAGRAARFVDIGSGFGGLALHLAALRKVDGAGEFLGIELAPLPWLVSWLRARRQGSAARFIRGDYAELDLGEYDVVFAYLSPAAMPSLWEKAHSEMRAGALLISYEFPIPGHAADDISQPVPGGPPLYVWRMR